METADHDAVIRISIGTEPMQHIPGEVLKSSILRRTSQPVEFTQSWNLSHGWHPLMQSVPRLKRGTRFNTWRWLVPELYGSGKAIYLDADQIVLTDIAELWNAITARCAIAAVRRAVGFFGKKAPDPDKVQSSVMVMHCEALRQLAPTERISDVHQGNLAYRSLMQAEWIPHEQVLELPPEWNHFGIVTPGTKLCHWSHVASQPYRNPDHPTADFFYQELLASIQASHVRLEDVREATRGGHLATSYLKRLKRDLQGTDAIMTTT